MKAKKIFETDTGDPLEGGIIDIHDWPLTGSKYGRIFRFHDWEDVQLEGYGEASSKPKVVKDQAIFFGSGGCFQVDIDLKWSKVSDLNVIANCQVGEKIMAVSSELKLYEVTLVDGVFQFSFVSNLKQQVSGIAFNDRGIGVTVHEKHGVWTSMDFGVSWSKISDVGYSNVWLLYDTTFLFAGDYKKIVASRIPYQLHNRRTHQLLIGDYTSAYCEIPRAVSDHPRSFCPKWGDPRIPWGVYNDPDFHIDVKVDREQPGYFKNFVLCGEFFGRRVTIRAKMQTDFEFCPVECSDFHVAITVPNRVLWGRLSLKQNQLSKVIFDRPFYYSNNAVVVHSQDGQDADIRVFDVDRFGFQVKLVSETPTVIGWISAGS